MTTPLLKQSSYSRLLGKQSGRFTSTQAAKIRKYINQNPEEYENRMTEYLWSPYWKGFLEDLFKESGNHCEACLEAVPEYGYHLTFKRLGEERLTDVLAVCRSCRNGMREGRLNVKTVQTTALQQRGWNPETTARPDISNHRSSRKWSNVYHREAYQRHQQSKRDRLKAKLTVINAKGGRADQSITAAKRKRTTKPKTKVSIGHIRAAKKRFMERNPSLNAPQI